MQGSTITQVAYDNSKPISDQVDQNSFLLVDEADTIFLDNAAVPTNKNIVGLSATVVGPSLNLERMFLSQHRFHQIDSKIAGYIDPDYNFPAVSVEQFIAKSCNYAKLVYVPGDRKHLFTDAVSANVTHYNCRDLARLHNLTKEDTLLIT